MNCRVCKDGLAVPFRRLELTGRTRLMEYLQSALNRDRIDIVIFRCTNCLSLFQCPTFKRETYWGWYQSSDYQFERGVGYAPSPHESIRYAKAMTEKTIGILGKRDGRVLDVGCGRGFYLAMCGDSGWEVQGCEISPVYYDYATEALGLPVWRNPYEVSEQHEVSFDLVTFWDIFEHFTEPGLILEKTKSLLHDDGVIAIEVPHAKGLYARILGKNWWFGFEHVFYYSIKGLVGLLLRHGFEPFLIATDNINLLSKEGLCRFRLFGEDGVWGRHGQDSVERRFQDLSLRRNLSQIWKNPSYRFYDLCRPLKILNYPFNCSLNSLYLGDQLRIFASKQKVA